MQIIKLKRLYLKETYTIGKLYLNENYICDTLEDRVRKFTADDPKIWGETAIPYGIYKVTKEINKKFGKCFRVHNVPHFEGILIHTGNYPKHTHGCILVGTNSVKGAVMDSRKYLDTLFNFISKSEKIELNIF